MGDGELEEGQIWEAAMLAPHRKLDNLIATVDCNGQQIDGSVKDIISLDNLKAKWEAFGWIVLESQGNQMESILETIEEAKKSAKTYRKPVMNLMKTEMGAGCRLYDGES